MRLRHVLYAVSAIGTMLVQGVALSLTRLDDHLAIEPADLVVRPAGPTSGVWLAASPAELDALYLASALHNGQAVSEAGVPITLGTGGGAEAAETERLAVAMLDEWGHFDE